MTGNLKFIRPNEKKSKFGQRLIALVACRNRFSRLPEPSVPPKRLNLFISYCRLRVPLNWKTSGKNSVRRLDLDDTDILLPKQIPRVIEIYEILLSARD